MSNEFALPTEAQKKRELMERIEILERRVGVLEAWASQLRREPTFFTADFDSQIERLK